MSVSLLVRTWNVFHGNADPPGRRGYLQTMLELASADRPDILRLQELPVWSLLRIDHWTGMQPVLLSASRNAAGDDDLGGVEPVEGQGDRLRARGP